MRQRGLRASQIATTFKPWPMQLNNIRLPDGADAGKILARKSVTNAIEKAEKKMGEAGRVIVRKSGTEPLIRVMVEAADENVMQAQLADICGAVESAL